MIRPWDGRPPRDWPVHPRPLDVDDEQVAAEIDEAIDRHPASSGLTPQTLWDAIDLDLVPNTRWFTTVIPSDRYL